MSHNPFVKLLEEFRWAAANLDTTGFGITAWWHFPRRFANPKREILGCCCLPVRYADHVQYHAFRLTVSVSGAHAKCGPVFADLASRAGAALPPVVRDSLNEHVPVYVSEMAPWWFALLWRLFVGNEPLQRPRSAETGDVLEEIPSIPICLPRPFLLSIDAIELCKLHTDQPVFPPPDGADKRHEVTGVETAEGWITVSEASQVCGVNKGTISRAAKDGQIVTNGKTGRDLRLVAGSLMKWVLDRSSTNDSDIPQLPQEEIRKRAREERKRKGFRDYD
jgi:hypothetical protein